MSATDIDTLPIPDITSMKLDDGITNAPLKPRTTSMNVKAIPYTVEEKEEVQEIFEEPVSELTTNKWEDPSEFLEAVFFNRHNNMIYKIYVNGTWESLRVSPDLLI
jgi:hypothetical protein